MRISKKGTMNYLTDREILKLAKEANLDYALPKEVIQFAHLVIQENSSKESKEIFKLLKENIEEFFNEKTEKNNTATL